MDLPFQTSAYWPFVVLVVSMVFVATAIAVMRIHAFVALMIAAMLAGVLSATLPETDGDGFWAHVIRAIELPMTEFGSTAGKIAWVIALASIIGVCLMESGAADKIVRVLVGLLGDKGTAWALLICGFFLGIPVFFDTVFFLLIPLAQALSLRTGKNYVLYVAAIASGAVITHSVVPPTPGPLFMVEQLGLNLASGIFVGILAGLIPAFVALLLADRMNRRQPIPVRETPGASLEELKALADKPSHELPPFWMSICPVAVPVLLIGLASTVNVIVDDTGAGLIDVLGNKFFAMFLGALMALGLLVRQKGLPWNQLDDVVGPPLMTAGVIILITAAGGAFGAMIKHAGVGQAVDTLASGKSISLVLVAWVVSAVMKIAQGSGTVAMITTASMMAAIIGDGSSLGYSPIWIYLAIGFGSMMFSWMNDSGFWVVCKLSGFTENETLRTWTVLLAVISVVGLVEVLIGSAVFRN